MHEQLELTPNHMTAANLTTRLFRLRGVAKLRMDDRRSKTVETVDRANQLTRVLLVLLPSQQEPTERSSPHCMFHRT